jgi:hypothetical protein
MYVRLLTENDFSLSLTPRDSKPVGYSKKHANIIAVVAAHEFKYNKLVKK